MNIILLFFILALPAISGCIEDKEGAPTPALPDISQTELVPCEFDINISSYYVVYMRDNYEIHENRTTNTRDLFEKNYVIYQLSIKNNDTNTHTFSIRKLELHTRDQIFTPADPDTALRYFKGWVFSQIENEDRLNETQLYPGQILEGIVIFQVNNYTTLWNRSFSLAYNTTPIPSSSYEKSLEALTAAEQFDYSIAYDMPPYDNETGEGYSYYPEPGSFYVWANWVNRTVFEYYKKYDEKTLPEEEPGNIPTVEIAYAVKVIPGQDLTVFHTTHSILDKERTSRPLGPQLYAVDDNGDEIFNRSIDPWNSDTGLAIFDNRTYRPFSENMPRMLIPHATIVHISFYSIYGWGLSMRLTVNDQDIILDEQHTIILARYDYTKFVS